jgi:hypothetical protein
LLAALRSPCARTYPHFQVWLVNSDDPRSKIFSHGVADLNDPRFEAKSFPSRNGQHSNSYGYFASEIALTSLLNFSEEQSDGMAYVLITNGDNLHHYKFFE